MTGRAWWLAVTALFAATVGIIADHAFLRILGASWFALLFAFFLYARYTLAHYKNQLAFRGEFAPGSLARVGEELQLRIEGMGACPGGLWTALIEPILTGRFEESGTAGKSWVPGSKSGDWCQTRKLRPTHAGKIEWLGSKIRLVDALGWWEATWSVAASKRVLVCPARVGTKGRPRGGKKKSNALWKPGLFQHDRSGQSLEFLGLRDFLAGDSPKRIAWKQTLRRDRMLVRETEWEVPVTVHLLVDAGPANRFRGPEGGSTFDALVPAIMGVMATAHEGHNPVGLTLVDPGFEESLPPGLGKIHVTKVEMALARKSARIPSQPDAPVDALIARAEPILQALFPAELDPATNTLPFWNAWIEGFPARSADPSWRRTLDARRYWFWFAGPLGWAGLPVVFALTEKERKLSQARKRIALLLCALEGHPPGTLERLLQDDAHFSVMLTETLANLGVEIGIPGHPFPNPGHFQERMGGHLAKTLLRQLARARDQQVFFLFLSSQSLVLGMGPIIESLRRTVSLGHKVWVADLGSESGKGPWEATRGQFHGLLARMGVNLFQGGSGAMKELLRKRLEKEGFLGKR